MCGVEKTQYSCGCEVSTLKFDTSIGLCSSYTAGSNPLNCSHRQEAIKIPTRTCRQLDCPKVLQRMRERRVKATEEARRRRRQREVAEEEAKRAGEEEGEGERERARNVLAQLQREVDAEPELWPQNPESIRKDERDEVRQRHNPDELEGKGKDAKAKWTCLDAIISLLTQCVRPRQYRNSLASEFSFTSRR